MGRLRLHVPRERLGGASLAVTGADHRHLARVLRVRPGAMVTLFDGAGGEVEARVARVGRSETLLSLGGDRAPSAAPTITGIAPIVLLTAVPRGGRMDVLVQKTSELGVARIVPVLAARSVARPEAGRRPRWEKIAREAARQCGRADVPEIDAPAALEAALALADLPARRVALYENEPGRPLRSLLGAPAPTALLVGPEGGFTAGEVAAARDAGFVTAGLGPRILRVETAAIVAVALVAEHNGQLG
jgi:16S rRNA (uracil1498-N3)-methyltransferase